MFIILMRIQFTNRLSEIKFLNEQYKNKPAQFIPIYGRRRIGKTELIKQFCKNKPHIYFLADKGKEIDQLKKMSVLIGEHFQDEVLLGGLYFENWDKVFDYITGKQIKNKLIIVIDEFPFLTESNKAVPSIFQGIWDEKLSKKNIFLILCGSSISMMEREVLFYKAPLYGRRTGQIRLDFMKFKDARQFLPSYDIKNQIAAYSILDGTPAYLLRFSDKKSIMENIKQQLLDKNASLYAEAEIILKEELREPNVYFSILRALSFGKTTPTEIANEIGENRTNLPRYFDTLENLHIIKKEIPITEKHMHKSRRGTYKIADNYFLFWFRFIYPYKSYIEEGNLDYILNILERDFNQHISLSFESICKEFLWELNKKDKLPFHFRKTGKWWSRKGDEIDLIALNEETKEIMFIECKWKENINAEKLLKELKEKPIFVDWYKGKREEYFCIIAKSFKKKVKEENVLLFDLEDIEKILSK